jgi:hypothetical protein
MADLVKLFRRLADELEQEEKGELSAAAERARDERIDELEARIRGASAEEREEAVEEITDEEWELIRRHRAGTTAEEPEPETEPEEEEAKPKMRRGRKRGRVYQDGKGEPGYVFHGDDEPDLVPVEEGAA